MPRKKKLRILVISGGPSAEHAISRLSGRMVAKALNAAKYSVTLAIVNRQRRWHFANRKGTLPELQALEYSADRFDVAFLALHGAYGEDGTIQALLQSIKLPYTGSGVAASAIAWNKIAAQQYVESMSIAVPKWISARSVAEAKTWKIFPCFVKPVEGGSSLGISLVNNAAQLRRILPKTLKDFGPVIIQKFVSGHELTCGVIEKHGAPYALPPTEIFPLTNTWFDYQSKYSDEGHRLETPPRIPALFQRRIQQISTRSHVLFGCRGLSRSDFILAGKTIWYLETNTIPGLTKLSLLPHEAQAAGMTFSQLLDRIIESAVGHKA